MPLPSEASPARQPAAPPAGREGRGQATVATTDGPRPHSVEAEEGVLGALLLDGEQFYEFGDKVHAEDFYLRKHQSVFRAITALGERSDPIDPVTVTDELARLNQLEAVGGAAAVLDLATSTPSVVNAPRYASIVIEHAGRRRLIDAADAIAHKAHDRSISAAEATDDAERRIFGLGVGRTSEDFHTLRDLTAAVMQEIERRADTDGTVTGVATGFAELDGLLSGLQPGNLVLLAARPSVGKSVMALNIAASVANAGGTAAFFSLEMSELELTERLLSAHGEVPLNDVRSADLDDDGWQRLMDATEDVRDQSLHIDATGGITLTELRSKCRRLTAGGGRLDLVVIDYLQLMGGAGGRRENRTQEVGAVSRGLKQLAKELQVPVLALSQLNRAVDQRPEQRPILSDLRESGDLEQDADIVIFLYREEMHDRETPAQGEAEAIIAKHRNGKLATVHLAFEGQYARFRDIGVVSPAPTGEEPAAASWFDKQPL